MNQSIMRAGALLVIAVALVAGGYLYQNHQRALTAQTNTALVATTSTPQFAPVTKTDIESGSGGTTNIIPITANTIYVAPKVATTLTFSAKLSDTEKATIQKSYTEAVALIIKDKLDFNTWIAIGTLNLMAGNYTTAETIWKYASAQWPTNVVSHNNLGDLYMNYLKDYPKAEKEFLAGIQNKSNDPNPYMNLFTLYSDTSYKPSNTAAEDILKKGIIANPTAVNLQYSLAVYYRKLGLTDKANAEFQVAIDNATKYGLPQVAAQIKTDMQNGK